MFSSLAASVVSPRVWASWADQKQEVSCGRRKTGPRNAEKHAMGMVFGPGGKKSFLTATGPALPPIFGDEFGAPRC